MQKLSVNYDLSIKEMIVAGNYRLIDRKITDGLGEQYRTYEKTGCHDLNIDLFHFNRIISSDTVNQEMKKKGYRPAGFKELLALGTSLKDKQLKYPVAMTMHAAWVDGYPQNAFFDIGWWGSQRALQFVNGTFYWPRNYRFLGISLKESK